VHRCCLETPRDRTYYDALWAFYNNGGVEKVAGWLLARNVEHFNPAASPPMTNAKRDMITATLPTPVQWLHASLVDEGPHAHRRLMLVPELEMKAANRGAPPGINHKSAAAALRAAGFEPLAPMKIDGAARTLWVRDPSKLLSKLSADQLRERYHSERSGRSMGGLQDGWAECPGPW
jgi:hypothetical protein